MFTGKGAAAQRILPAHGVELSAFHITHEMLGIAHAVPTHANKSKTDGSHANLLDRHVSHATRPLPHHHPTVWVCPRVGYVFDSMVPGSTGRGQGTIAETHSLSTRCPLAAPLQRHSTM